jgi:hypothetical protein
MAGFQCTAYALFCCALTLFGYCPIAPSPSAVTTTSVMRVNPLTYMAFDALPEPSSLRRSRLYVQGYCPLSRQFDGGE